MEIGVSVRRQHRRQLTAPLRHQGIRRRRRQRRSALFPGFRGVVGRRPMHLPEVVELVQNVDLVRPELRGVASRQSGQVIVTGLKQYSILF